MPARPKVGRRVPPPPPRRRTPPATPPGPPPAASAPAVVVPVPAVVVPVPAVVAVWPTRDVAGLDRLADAEEVLWHPVRSLRDALTTTYDTDAHLCPLVVYEGDPPAPADTQPRLNVGVIRELREAGAASGTAALVSCAFIDVDRPKHEPWPTMQAGAAVARGLLDAHGGPGGVLERAAVYLTRAGWRAVYALDPPVSPDYYAGVMGRPYAVETPAGPRDASGLLGWFADAVGPGVDPSCNSPMRCYRAPRVIRDGEVQDPPILEVGSLDAGPLDVRRWLEGIEARATAPSPVMVDLSRPDLDPLTAAQWASAGIEGRLRKRWPSMGDQPGLASAIRGRRAWFGSGERNESCFKAVCLIVELLYTAAAEADNPQIPHAQDVADFTFRALAPGVISASTEGVSTTPIHDALDELWTMVVKRIGTETAKIGERLKERARQEEARARVAVAARAVATVGPEAPAGGPEEAPYAPAAGPEGGTPSGGPSMGLAPLVAVGGGYMVLDARDPDRPTYFPFTRNNSLVMALLLRGCGSQFGGEDEGPLGLNLRRDDGGLRALPSLVIDYAVQVTEVVIAHGVDHPILDVGRARLQIPGACPQPVEPKYDEQIAEWLRLMGGGGDPDDPAGDHGRLLDWLATLTRLDRPTCALYLQGDPGTGKGLFAACATSVFGSGYNKFETAVSRFNSGLSRSPIIFLDERAQLPPTEQVSAAFRSLVAETEHRIEPKGQEVMTLRGAMRVIVAANNAEALPLVGSLTRADIDAVTSRILWIGVAPEAEEYLKEIGGRAATEAWVGKEGVPGAFAAHVRHLEITRNVTPGPRFLVTGRLREYHEYLTLSADRLSVLHAVAKGILAGPNQMKAAGIYMEPGRSRPYYAAVSAADLRRKWSGITGERIVPGQQQISGALRALGGVEQIRRGDLRLYRIPDRYLTLACDRLGLPTWILEDNMAACALAALEEKGRRGKK